MLVYVEAQAPWGPVRIGTAAGLADLARQVVGPPVHVEDVGSIAGNAVADAARTALGTVGGGGWIDARPGAALTAVKDARARILARVVAAGVADASHGPPVSQDGAAASTGGGLGNNPVRGASSARETFLISAGPEMLRATSLAELDVKAIRVGLGMTQAGFAVAFCLPVATVRGWEQGRFPPDGAALALLRVIRHRPDVVREAVGGTCGA